MVRGYDGDYMDDETVVTIPTDPKELAWWRIGVLDAERDLPPRATPWEGVAWEEPLLQTRYRQGYDYLQAIRARWAAQENP